MPHRTLKDIVGGRKLIEVPPDANVHDACAKMTERHVTAVLIVDKTGPMPMVQGIFTKRDLLRRVTLAGLEPSATPVSEVMTPSPFCMDGARSGFEAVRLMREEKTRHVVVTGLDGGNFGVISRRDILGQELATFEKELDFENKIWEEI